MDETKPKKMVSRNVAISLGIVCIVLIAFLAGMLVSMNAQVTKLQNQVNDFNDLLSMNESKVIVNQTVDVPSAPEEVPTAVGYQRFFSVSYSGYLWVYVQPLNASAQSAQIWVDVNWIYGFPTSTPMVYDEKRNYGGFVTDDTLYYPIVENPNLIPPTPNIVVSIGSNSTNTIAANVTITYTY